MPAPSKIRATAEMVDSNPHMPDMLPGSTHWRVTLRYRHRQLTVPYSQGPAICKEPTAADVLGCLLLDACGVENAQGSFEAWCDEYGYDTDSRKAEAIFKATAEQAAKLRALLGEEYEDLVYSDTEKTVRRMCA